MAKMGLRVDVKKTKSEQRACSLLTRVLFFRWSDYLIIDGNKQNNILIILYCPLFLGLYAYFLQIFGKNILCKTLYGVAIR